MAVPALLQPLANPAFRRFWGSYTLGIFAVNFFFVGLTWLVLATTGAGSMLGAVLAANGIPRAVLMLIGGTITDRYAPHVVYRTALTAQAALIAVLAGLLFADALAIWHLFVIAALLGIGDAFLLPSALAAVPRLVPVTQLPLANGLVQVSEIIAQIGSPFLSGVAMASLGLDRATGLNAVLYAAAAALLIGFARRRTQTAAADSTAAERGSVWEETKAGLRYTVRQPAIRVMLLLIAGLNLMAIGPIIVGGAALVQIRLGGGADMYGAFMAAFGLGTPFGLAIAALRGQPARPERIVPLVGGLIGAVLALFSVAASFPALVVLAALIGMGAGYFTLVANVYIQTHTAPHMHGRTMAVVMFATVALDPLSQAYAGFMIDVSLPVLFGLSGVGMIGIALIAAVLARWVRTTPPVTLPVEAVPVSDMGSGGGM